MKAVVWHGKEDVRVDEVADPRIHHPTDAIIKVTSTAICGSDLHLYSKLGPVMREGDIIGHEPMGIVQEVGHDVRHIRPGDRVVVPFNISCGACFMCSKQLYSQCEVTQIDRYGKGAALFGYTHLYGAVPGGQAAYLRVPQAHFGPIKVPVGPPDHRFLFLSDVLPTAWQAVSYAEVAAGGVVGVWGLGPVGQMCARIAYHFGAERVIGIDKVPERLAMAELHGVESLDFSGVEDLPEAIRDLTGGRGLDVGIDAVGMESDGTPWDTVLEATRLRPDNLRALKECLGSIRRGGVCSITGVYTGAMPMFPLGDLFDKQISLRMGQANVRRWADQILPLLNEEDPLGVNDLATHFLPLDEAPWAYEAFQKKKDGAIKIVLQP